VWFAVNFVVVVATALPELVLLCAAFVVVNVFAFCVKLQA
jgi:hypothetical protein